MQLGYKQPLSQRLCQNAKKSETSVSAGDVLCLNGNKEKKDV